MNISLSLRLADTRQRAASAFTLIELLVVISIIAILAGILLPVIGGVTDTAHKAEAKNTVMQIVTAVKAFQTDYGVYPNPGNVATDKTWTNVTNQDLFAILRATDSATGANASVNTRRNIYFEGKDVKSPTKPKGGFLPTTAAAATTTVGGYSATVQPGALVDPWGNGYYIRYDTNYSDAVLHPYSSEADGVNDDPASTSTLLRFGVIAWSHGKDLQKGKAGTPTGTAPSYTNDDDVVSWQ